MSNDARQTPSIRAPPFFEEFFAGRELLGNPGNLKIFRCLRGFEPGVSGRRYFTVVRKCRRGDGRLAFFASFFPPKLLRDFRFFCPAFFQTSTALCHASAAERQRGKKLLSILSLIIYIIILMLSAWASSFHER